MVKKFFAVFLPVMLLCQISIFAAGDLYSANVRQVYCFKDLMRVYIDMKDKSSNPIDIPSTADISGYIDSNRLTPRKAVRFSESGEGVADIFLVDSSGSIRDAQMGQVKAAIKTWASNMNPNDRIAVISFGDNTEVKIDYSNDINAINRAVDNLTNNDKNTQLYGGIMEALKMTDRNDSSLPKRKNIVLITDGVNDYSGGISENDIYEELKNRLVPVYCLWMSGSKESNSKGRASMNSIANYSGGTMYDMSGKELDTVYGWVRQNIQNSCVVDFTYGAASADNNEHVFNLRVSQKDRIAEDNVKFTMKKSDEDSGTYRIDTSKSDEESEKNEESKAGEKTEGPAEEEDGLPKSILLIICIIAVLIAAGIVIAVVIRRRNAERYNDDISYQPASVNTYDGMAQTQQNTVRAQMSTYPVRFTSVRTGMVHTINMSDAMTVGRHSSNTFVLEEQTVSGNHAMITRIGSQMYIEDLSSKNGTLINGCHVSGKTEIHSGDMISFGSDEYHIQF